jgi:hypothetical protein
MPLPSPETTNGTAGTGWSTRPCTSTTRTPWSYQAMVNRPWSPCIRKTWAVQVAVEGFVSPMNQVPIFFGELSRAPVMS